MAQKVIKSFQSYLLEQNTEVSPTWSEVRDTLQMKRPFAILVFRTRSSYLDYLKDNKDASSLIKQVAILKRDNQKVNYPSVFLVLGSDVDYSDQIRNLYNKYDIKMAIAGQANVEYAKLYSADGTSAEVGNEIISTLTPADFDNDECFKLGSTYYRFIDFQG